MAQQPTRTPDNGDNCTPDKPDQPDKWGCWPLPSLPEVPDLPKAIECEQKCNCPQPPRSTGTCFDSLISEQTELLNKAAAAKQFKDDLEDLLKKATAGRQNYNPKKYTEFLEKWKKQDEAIKALIEKLHCHIDCWECLVRCEICPLFYKIRDMQRELEGTGELIGTTYSLRDQQHWYARLKYEREAAFNRIKDVLKAWEDPSKAIEKNLNDNQTWIDKIEGTILCSDPVEAAFRIFVNLIPMHLAIGPRNTDKETQKVDGKDIQIEVTKSQSTIDQKYWNICECDPGTRDECCGPNVGALSVIDQLIGPQTYIVDPNEYFDIICCLATSRYIPAKKNFDEAAAKLVVIDEKIKRYEAEILKKKKEVFEDYRASVIIPVDCKKYMPKKPINGCDDGEESPEQEEDSAR